MDSDEELFLTQHCLSQEILEPNFSMGFIIDEQGNDLRSDAQKSFHEDLNPRKKIKGEQTDPRKTLADRRIIAIVDDGELQNRKVSLALQNTRGQSVSGFNGQRRNDLNFCLQLCCQLGSNWSRRRILCRRKQ